MMGAYSDDLRARVLEAVQEEGCSIREAAERFKVGKTWVGKILQRLRETGHAGALSTAAGPGPSLDAAHRAQLETWLREDPDLTQQQLADRLAIHGPRVDRSTVGRTLRGMGWTRKKRVSSPPSSSVRRSRSNGESGPKR